MTTSVKNTHYLLLQWKAYYDRNNLGGGGYETSTLLGKMISGCGHRTSSSGSREPCGVQKPAHITSVERGISCMPEHLGNAVVAIYMQGHKATGKLKRHRELALHYLTGFLQGRKLQ